MDRFVTGAIALASVFQKAAGGQGRPVVFKGFFAGSDVGFSHGQGNGIPGRSSGGIGLPLIRREEEGVEFGGWIGSAEEIFLRQGRGCTKQDN